MASDNPDLDNIPGFPINTFFGEGVEPNPAQDPHPLLYAADVIFGRDVMSRRQFLLYGRKTLRKISKSKKGRPLAILVIELDQETEELEKAAALVSVIKGRHDYRASA